MLMFGSDAPEAESLVDRAVAAVGLFVGSVERISAAYRSAAYGFSSEREFVNRTAVRRRLRPKRSCAASTS